jgi:hypothetical protein
MALNLINKAANLNQVSLGSLTIWFSYETPVAIQRSGQKPVVAANEWSVATGRHLNLIDGGDKATRVAHQVVKDAIADSVSAR